MSVNINIICRENLIISGALTVGPAAVEIIFNGSIDVWDRSSVVKCSVYLLPRGSDPSFRELIGIARWARADGVIICITVD